jgi:hypothetical protein
MTASKIHKCFRIRFKKRILKAAIKLLNLKKLSFKNAVQVCELVIKFPFPIHTPSTLTHCKVGPFAITIQE